MSEFNARMQSLLDAAQAADEPTQSDYDRVHSAVLARIAVGAIAGVAVTAGEKVVQASLAPAATVTSATSLGVGAKAVLTAGSVGLASAVVPTGGALSGAAASAGTTALGLASGATTKVVALVLSLGLVGGAVGATAYRWSERHDAPGHTPNSHGSMVKESESPTTRTSAVAHAPSAALAAPQSPAEPGAAIANAPSPNARSVRATSSPAGAEAPPTPETITSSPSPAAIPSGPSTNPAAASEVEAEIALLGAARTALLENRPGDALAALERHAARFPNGTLAEDRAAERVFALCALGRVEAAREEATSFLATRPRSPHVGSIRTSCPFTDARSSPSP
jgi:hypothetical protein